jgi:hypothetical protein
MKPRFYIILVLFSLAMLGWTFVHHQFEDNKRFRLQQLSALPVYVYMTDEVRLDTLAVALKEGVPEIDSLFKESGVNAAKSLLKDYQLGIEPNTLENYTFPSILTLSFKPVLSSYSARDKAIEILQKYKIPAADIDTQTAAWNTVKKELDYLRQRWVATILFTALLFFLMVLFARLFLSRADSSAQHDPRSSVLEKIRSAEMKKWQSVILFLVPVAFNIIVYNALSLFKLYASLAGWLFFLIQAAALLAGILIAVMLENMREPDIHDSAHAITVTKS